MLVTLEIKISLVSIKDFLCQGHPLYTRRVSSYKMRTIYLGVIEACLSVTIAMFQFSRSKLPSNIMKKIFNSFSVCSKNKISFLVNKYKKQMCFQENKSLFFDVNGKLFPSKIFFSREIGKIRTCKEVRMQKLIKFRLSEQYSF